MLLLGIDLGTSSVKVSVVDGVSRQIITSASYPEKEAPVVSTEPGYAEQEPESWWEFVKAAIKKVNATQKFNPAEVGAIGIAYQMHGLVMVDSNKDVIRPSIIWCDSRAVAIGDKAFDKIGSEVCLSTVLNSPANFTASKLAWVKENEPELYKKTYKIMLPGDFIAMKLTGEINTSAAALSEGVLYDFKKDRVSKDVLNYFDFPSSIIPDVHPVFAPHGTVTAGIAAELGLKAGIPVTYKAGDQPNNALALNVLQPGDVAANGGTSGVVYAVTDKLTTDDRLRVNSFAHVNYSKEEKRIGVLLCINGTGILNRWVKDNIGTNTSYQEMNKIASAVPAGSEGLQLIPFGNGAERILNNKMVGAHLMNIDFNRHTNQHIFRAAQEGIAYSFRYGIDLLKEVGITPSIIKAGHTNMFLSELFVQTLVDVTGIPVELYSTDGAAGAAIGAGIGAGVYASAEVAFTELKPIKQVNVSGGYNYEDSYQEWKMLLERML